MKICYLNHNLDDNTGAGRFCLSLLKSLKKEIPSLEYRVLTHDNFLPNEKIRLIFALSKIRAVFRKYDVIHALDGWPYGVIAAIASLGLKKKLVITAIGTGAIQPLYNFWKRPFLKWAYKQADRVIAVSNNTKREILKVIPNLEIEVINHGVDSAKFQFPIPSSQLSVSKPYILSVGALKKRKGYNYALKAFAEVSRKFPNLKYIILGRGTEKKELELEIQRLDIENKVRFLSAITNEELAFLYQNAELFILLPQDVNKDIEGFGLVFLEAAAAGLPVVATQYSGAEDAVLSGKTGFLVPQEDFKMAAVAMEKLLIQPKLKNLFSKESFNFSKTMSWLKIARQYNYLYNKLLS